MICRRKHPPQLQLCLYVSYDRLQHSKFRDLDIRVNHMALIASQGSWLTERGNELLVVRNDDLE